MSTNIDLEKIEQLAEQLSPKDQLRIITRISQRLSRIMLPETVDDQGHNDYANQIKDFLRMSDEMAAESVCEVDSAEDIRQIREERMSRL